MTLRLTTEDSNFTLMVDLDQDDIEQFLCMESEAVQDIIDQMGYRTLDLLRKAVEGEPCELEPESGKRTA